MNKKRNTILVVEDQIINRKIIKKILSSDYDIIEATNGKEAFEAIEEYSEIKVILLDIVMPVMNGFQFMDLLRETGKTSIPVVIMTANNDKEMERKALDSGALDFVSKPLDPEILLRRVKNALERNQMIVYQKLLQASTHDPLTGIYNRRKMFSETKLMLDKYPEEHFAFLRFDIDKFKLYNSVMGEAEGDKLLLYIANHVQHFASQFTHCTYGRIDADVFCVCCPFEKELFERNVPLIQMALSQYKEDYRLKSSLGVCIIDDKSLSVESLFTNSSLASDKCKRLYDVYYAYYSKDMSEDIVEEQDIMNEVKEAFSEERFEVYLQPKYDLSMELPTGAEALVRWRHPDKGMMSPGKFISIFEKNGIVAELDHYMWEKVCQLLHKWMEEGERVAPVSVNMSRVSLYNPHVVEDMQELIQKYNVPAKLLNLEITESAYMSNPTMMKETVNKLHDAGFVILMDDFGSGYSSLNTLKEIDIDILKLDMKFLPVGEDMTKAEKIISSMVRMAGWLGMEVIAEGVETREQKEFLESVGCGYVQGYYYAKPMPVADYEKLMHEKYGLTLKETVHFSKDEMEAFWSSDPRIEQILAGIEIPLAIIEVSELVSEYIRTNQAFQKLYGYTNYRNMHGIISPEEEHVAKNTFSKAIKSNESETCEVSYITPNGDCFWTRIKVKKITQSQNATLLCCIFEDITSEKLNENRLNNLIQLFENVEQKKILVVDDVKLSRDMIKNMFEGQYDVIEAEDGLEGIELLEKYAQNISVILLDMHMPKMDGKEFLQRKNQMKLAKELPVIVISAEDNSLEQLGMLKNGVHDYITKPFDSDITRQKVENTIMNQERFNELIREYRRDIRKQNQEGNK